MNPGERAAAIVREVIDNPSKYMTEDASGITRFCGLIAQALNEAEARGRAAGLEEAARLALGAARIWKDWPKLEAVALSIEADIRKCVPLGSMPGIVAALFVAPDSIYRVQPWVDSWPEFRDARKYNGPHPAVAHPPCERWGRYWGGGPSAKKKRCFGDDNGCFASALDTVRLYGGVVEHPADSGAWKVFGLPIPNKKGGWTPRDRFGGRACHVEQGHYGHPARKATWLYWVCAGETEPMPLPELKWGPSEGRRLDEGFHSTEERRRARAAGKKPVKRLSKRECVHTPKPFAELLLSLARSA